MSPTASPDDNRLFDKILEALESEDFELLAENTQDYLSHRKDSTVADVNSFHPYAQYLNLFANGYRRWQISYNYTEIRNYFYAAKWHLSKVFPVDVPDLAQAFYELTEMLNSYTRCENSFINDDPFALEHHAMEAQNAERKGLEILRRFQPDDSVVRSIKGWLETYFEKNLQLHTGLEACARIYSRIFKHEPCPEEFFAKEIRVANEALTKLSDNDSEAHSIELASELNAHIRIITQHYERTRGHFAGAGPTFLLLQQGTVTLCLSAGCDPTVARGIVAESAEFKKRIKDKFDSCGLEMTNFRAAPLHDIFQTSFGSHFLQMLAFDLPSITVAVSDSLKRAYKFNVHVKLTSLGSCTVYLSHEVEEPGLTVEEVRTLQSFVCPHAGQVKIEINRPPSDSKIVPLSAFKFSERFECVALDDLNALERSLQESGDAQGTLGQSCRSARGELEKAIDKFSKHPGFAAKRPADDGSDPHPSQQRLFGQMAALCNLLQLNYPPELGAKLIEHCNQLAYVTDFADWILDNVERAFRQCITEVKSKEDYEHDRRWLVSRDTGWYGYVYARSLQFADSKGRILGTVDSFEAEAVKEHSDVHGFLIEPREARASFDDWRFMTFRWKNYPNLASIRSHPCDAFFASENRAFLYFPDDPKFLSDQYEVTVELMMWLGTALKFCERLSQRLVQDVSICLNTESSLLNDKNVKQHLDWISRLRVQAGAVQALVSKAGISRYADHGELMTQMVENMKFLRIVELLDRRLAQFDQFYKKVEDETTYDVEDSARLTDSFILLVGAILTISEVHSTSWRIFIFFIIGVMGLLRISKRFRRPIFRKIKVDRW
jgi:hypothetical protein